MSRESRESDLLPERGFKQWPRELLLDDSTVPSLFKSAASHVIAETCSTLTIYKSSFLDISNNLETAGYCGGLTW